MSNYFGIDVKIINKTRLVELEVIEKYKLSKRATKRKAALKPKPALIKKCSRKEKTTKSNYAINKNHKVFLVKVEHKIIAHKPKLEVDESKKTVRFEYIEEQEPSPLYNLIYPKSMLIKK